MRPINFGLLAISILCLFTVVLDGCVISPPPQFYTLSALRNPEPMKQAASAAHTVIVAIGPIMIPDYLDKLEIVTRSGPTELKVNEFHRWAGALNSTISRAMIENLSSLLPSERFSVIRWIPGMQVNTMITYRITVDVLRFDVAPGDVTVFEVGWTIHGNNKEPVLVRKSIITEPVKGTDFNEMVAAMSKAVEDFSREVADVLKSQRNGN